MYRNTKNLRNPSLNKRLILYLVGDVRISWLTNITVPQAANPPEAAKSRHQKIHK
jgi:hypothetical protein